MHPKFSGHFKIHIFNKLKIDAPLGHAAPPLSVARNSGGE
jgi:hypothetical protein